MLSADVERRDGKDVVVLSVSPEQKAKIIYLSSVMYSSMTKLYHVVDSLLTSEESDSTSLGRRVIWNRRPKLVYQNFEYMLLVDLENSRMKIVTFTFSFDKKERQEEFPEQETDYDGQFTQDLSDLDLFSQEPQSPSQTSGFDYYQSIFLSLQNCCCTDQVINMAFDTTQ
ncbi:hypothetical protein E2C01_037058 [Portunus trituberculatus]|uniref:Uncharacterized protein n=1 Tax=Portunus trituberculatus TaxID=210409 RepID=A0A5B7F8C3_PORTR|nr:hypothetical protein [Portunus trituberculatus]